MIEIYRSKKFKSSYLVIYQKEVNKRGLLNIYGSKINIDSKKVTSANETLNLTALDDLYEQVQLYECYFNGDLITDLIKVIEKEREKELKRMNKQKRLLSSTMFTALIILEKLQKTKELLNK